MSGIFAQDAGSEAALAMGSMGNVRTTTLRAFNEDEASKIIASIPGQ